MRLRRFEYNLALSLAIAGGRNLGAWCVLAGFGALDQRVAVSGCAERTNSMSTAIMERQLLDGLAADRVLASNGYTAGASPTGSGVIVERQGYVRGLWHWQNGAFVLTAPGSHSPAVEVETLAEAIRYTRDVLCQAP